MKISYTISPEDYRLYYRKSSRQFYLRNFLPAAVFLSILLFQNHGKVELINYIGLNVGVVVIALVATIIYKNYQFNQGIKKFIAKSGEAPITYELEIAEKGMVLSKGEEFENFNWNALKKFKVTPDFIWIQFQDNSFTLIMKSAFAKNDELANFIGELKQFYFAQRNLAIAKQPADKPPYWLAIFLIIPIFGILMGLIMILLGIFRYKDKRFTLFSVAGLVVLFFLYFLITYLQTR